MATSMLRKKLADYIQVADTKKVKAMYALLENDMPGKWEEDEVFYAELQKRSKEMEEGKVEVCEWDEIKKDALARTEQELRKRH